MKKRLLSLFAAFCLIAAMVPAPTHAAGTDTPGADTVARVGDAYYTELDTAIAAASDGGTVKLFLGADNTKETLELENYVRITNSVTLDLNGKTLDFKTAKNNAPGLFITTGATSVTIQNGTVRSGELNAYGAVYINTASNVTVNLGTGLTVSSTNGGPAIILSTAGNHEGAVLNVNAGASVLSEDIDNSEVNCAAISNSGIATINVFGTVEHRGTYSAIAGNWRDGNDNQTTINVMDGGEVMQTPPADDGAGILMLSKGTVTVKDGGKVSGYSGIAAMFGTITVQDGAEVTGVGAYREYKSTTPGMVYPDGSAIFIDPAAAMSVVIEGGKLTSTHGHAVSARDIDNKDKGLSIAVKGGTLIGAKSAIAVNDLTGIVSGGAFSSAVDKDLLSDALKFVAKKGSGDAPYSYHETEAEAKTAAGTDGTVTAVGSESETPDPDATYTVTIASGITNGTVTADKDKAKKGETVTLTITPSSGYSIGTISTTPALTLSGSGSTRTFTMPASDVTISATFTAGSTSSTALRGTVVIDGWGLVGETVTARVINTNNTGRLYYQWTANGYYLSGETFPSLYLTDYTYGKVIRCVVTSSVQTGSITGRLSGTVDYENGRYYPTESPGNASGTNQGGNSEAEDGFRLESPILATATNADGTKTTTIIEPDGSSGLVMLTSYGAVSSVSMTFSNSAFADALRTGGALTLPTTVQSSRSADSAAPVRIVLPQTIGSVKVKIPVSQMTSGTVAVMENYFGPDTVVRSSVSERDGVVFRLTGSAVVKIVDNSRSFQDVSSGAWYAGAVNWVSSREVMTGVSPKMFDPQGKMNRAMMAQMLYNFDGANSAGVATQFSDVSSNDWYAASVSWATRNGIARSYGDRFGAEDALTREDMAVMLYNYARLKGYGTYASSSMLTFPDNGSVSDWARSAMQWAVGAGLITGTQNGTRAIVLDPQGTVTRAQLATIMQRFNNLY